MPFSLLAGTVLISPIVKPDRGVIQVGLCQINDLKTGGILDLR